MTTHNPNPDMLAAPNRDSGASETLYYDAMSETSQQAARHLFSGVPNNPVGKLYSEPDYSVLLQVYLCAAIVANLLLIFFDGHGGDIGFWENWVNQLATNGYHEFNGNYPPMYVHWLYMLGQLYNFLDMPAENGFFLKFLSQVPVLLSHLAFTGIIFALVKSHAQDKLHFHAAMLLAALNPAILFNGPIWGQVDVMPVAPVLLALLASFHPKWRLATMPLYALALLTKFQMIAFAPIFGVIFFRHIKSHLIGAALSIGIIALLFLPSIVSGSFWSAFKFAYIDVLKQYGLTTMGAANIWILLTGNAAPDNIVLFNVDPESWLALIFTAKNFGIILFFLVCLWVFIKGITQLIKEIHAASAITQMRETFFYGMICSVAFFTLLPAMHERYLLPAVMVSLAYYAITPSRVIYTLALCFVSAFNLAMTHGIQTPNMWPSISWIMLAILIYCILDLALSNKWVEYSKSALIKIAKIPYLALWVLMLGGASVFYHLHQQTIINTPTLASNEMLLTDLQPAFSRQDFGRLQIHKNVSQQTLSVDGKRYAYGLGTHANSRIDYLLPPNTTRLTVLPGLDDSRTTANVRFSIWGDDKLMWEATQYATERNLPTVELDLSGIQRLSLRVSGIRTINNAHANWINPIILLDEYDEDNDR